MARIHENFGFRSTSGAENSGFDFDTEYDYDASGGTLATFANRGTRKAEIGHLGDWRDYFNVRTHGAKGDGSTDDTTAIQNAINACEDAGGGTVVIPPGTYRFSVILNGENVLIRGAGPGNTLLKLIDNLPNLYREAGEGDFYGVGAKNSIGWCGFRDFEIDGNAANNRAWDGEAVFGDLHTHCLALSNELSKVPPTRAFIDNVYAHDAVRNCFLWADDCIVDAGILRGKNSDADHIFYCGSGSVDTAIIEESWSRGGFITAEGINVGTLRVEGVATNPTTTYAASTPPVIANRDTHGGKPAKIGQVHIENWDPAKSLSAILWLGSIEIGALHLEQTTAETDTFRLVDAAANLSENDGPVLCEIGAIDVRGVMADGFRICESRNGDMGLFILNGGRVKYNASSGTNQNTNLFNIVEDGEVHVRALRIKGTGQRLFTTASGHSPRLVFDDVEMVDGISSTNGFNAATGAKVAISNSRFADTTIGATAKSLIRFQNTLVGTGKTENSGEATFSGDGSTVAFNIAHGLKAAPSHFMLVPTTSAAAATHYVSSTTGTNIVVTFAAAPASATDNVKFMWRASVSPAQTF